MKADEALTSAARGRGAWDRLGSLMLRRPVLAVVLAAVLARLACIAGVMAFAGGTLFVDDSTYRQLASQMASDATTDWAPAERQLYETTRTFLVPLTAVYHVFGPTLLGGQLLTAAFGTAAAAATARLTLELAGRTTAVSAGLVVALLPSQVLFSSVILKDAAVWAVLALLALAVAVHGRSAGWGLLAPLGSIGVLYVLLANLREHTLVAAAWAAALAACLAPGPDRARRALGVLGLTIAVPMALGLGPGGLTFVADKAGTLDDLRSRNAVGAETAFVTPSPPSATAAPDPVPQPPAQQIEPPTPAPGTLAPEPSPTPPTATPSSVVPPASPEADVSVPPVLRGLSAVVLEPFPHQVDGKGRLQLALAENVVWWPLLLLALVGGCSARRQLRVLAFPILCGGGIVLLYALSEGNFGTAYRHRGEIVWAVGILAAYGAREVLSHPSRPRS